LQDAVRLFALGEQLKPDCVVELLSESLVSRLLALGLLGAGGDGYDLAGRRFVSHFGLLLLCDLPTTAARLYYGNDSLALSRMLQNTRGRVLDLCAGVGTQGMLCALTAEQVVAVEREASAAGPFSVNAVINRLRDKIELRIGDLLEPVRGETFDEICCNPPLLPIPTGLEFPQTADGGPDGGAFVARILEALPELLSPRGRCHLIGTALGDSMGPNLERQLLLARRNRLDLFIILPDRASLAGDSPFLDGLAATAGDYGALDRETARTVLERAYAQEGAEYLYPYLLTATRTEGTAAMPRVEVTSHYLRGSKFWSV
jgi:hypothetical protein